MVGGIVEVVCIQDLPLKVSGNYLNFWLSYLGFLIKWLTCQKDERGEQRFIRSMLGMGDQEGRNVEDVEGSRLDTLRKGSSLMSWMMLFYPKEDTLKVSFGYVY